ncbi:MAG: hypothetical protein CMH05_03500 [Marinovum sp.]|nr:hypothetical protein [Marinovum sp.]|tara:strand:- start:2089 stop:2475 length:387 start_codon:yes stop_codon:yes gene_type:complete
MALTKVNSAGVKDNEIVNADLHSAANIAGTKLADDTIAEVKLDVSNTPTAGHFLQYKDNSDQLTWAQASSPEVYGFNTDANGNLIVTTTNGGADNISGTAYAAFEDVIYAATGFTFSVNTDGKLIATI